MRCGIYALSGYYLRLEEKHTVHVLHKTSLVKWVIFAMYSAKHKHELISFRGNASGNELSVLLGPSCP